MTTSDREAEVLARIYAFLIHRYETDGDDKTVETREKLCADHQSHRDDGSKHNDEEPG